MGESRRTARVLAGGSRDLSDEEFTKYLSILHSHCLSLVEDPDDPTPAIIALKEEFVPRVNIQPNSTLS
jgi:hypothetical protein